MVSPSIYTLLQNCTVRIETDTDRGTGFFVAPGKLLTCAHVVGDGDITQLRLYWSGTILKVIALDADENLDLALLTVQITEHPCVYLDREVTPGDRLYSYGYPDPMEKRDGVSLTMECEGTGDRGQILSLKGENIRSGFSGAPVLNQVSLSVCGLIRSERGAIAVASPRVIRAIGGQAVPLNVILVRWKDLEQDNQAFHKQNLDWQEAIAKEKASLEKEPQSISQVFNGPVGNVAVNNIGKQITNQNTLLSAKAQSAQKLSRGQQRQLEYLKEKRNDLEQTLDKVKQEIAATVDVLVKETLEKRLKLLFEQIDETDNEVQALERGNG